MHLSPFDNQGGDSLANREPRARRVGEILSILFLASLGTIATMTSVPAGGQAQSDTQIALTAPTSATAR